MNLSPEQISAHLIYEEQLAVANQQKIQAKAAAETQAIAKKQRASAMANQMQIAQNADAIRRQNYNQLSALVHRFQNNITMTQSPQAFHPSYISI